MKAARDLIVGDVVEFARGGKAAVLRVPAVLRECRDRRVITFRKFSDNTMYDEAFHPDSQFTVHPVENISPVQAKAEELFNALRWSFRFIETYAHEYMGPATLEINKVRALLDELDPPKPPTLEEAIAELRSLTVAARYAGLSALVEGAENFLKRVPN